MTDLWGCVCVKINALTSAPIGEVKISVTYYPWGR